MKIIQNGSKIPAEEYQAQVRRSVLFKKKTIKTSSMSSDLSDIKRLDNNSNNLFSSSAASSIDNAKIMHYKNRSSQDVHQSITGDNRTNDSLQTVTLSRYPHNTETIFKNDSDQEVLQNTIQNIKESKAAKKWNSTRRTKRNKSYENIHSRPNEKVSNNSHNKPVSTQRVTTTSNTSTSTYYIRGQLSSSPNVLHSKGADTKKIVLGKAQENARIKGFLRNRNRSVKAGYKGAATGSIYAKKAARNIVAAADGKSKLYLLLAAFAGLILIVIIMFVLTLVSIFKPQYSTLTMRDLMKIYDEAWSNELTETSMSMTLEEAGTFGYLYGDTGIDWRQVLSIYYAALLTETESSPEVDLELASNGSVLDNESGSVEGNVFGRIFWLLNDVVETNSITVFLPDTITTNYRVRTGDGITDWVYNPDTTDPDYITCIPIIHRDPEVVMDILGFTEWQKTTARMYYNDTSYDSYFAGIINTLNYGSGDVMVYTAQQEIGNTGHVYRSWFVGSPQTGHQKNWCVIFASWCAYQCGYSTLDGQLGIVPKHNDTTGIYNWYVGHPEAGTAYYCYRGAMDPDEIPIQPGSFVIWERDGDTSHQDHLSMITAYYPETQTFDTIDGNSYDTAYAPSEYYVCEHHNRSWSDKIYAILVPAYPDENLDLEYSPLENAIEEGRYPDNYEDIISTLETVNLDSCTIQNTIDLSVRDAYERLEWYMNQGVNPISFTEPTYHSGNISCLYEQEGWTGMDWIVYGEPTKAHLRFYSNINLPEWYFADGYYSHYRDCSDNSTYRSDVLS